MYKVEKGKRQIDALCEILHKYDNDMIDVNVILTEGADIRSREVRHVNQFYVITNNNETMVNITDDMVAYLLESNPNTRYKSIDDLGSYGYIPLNGKRRAGLMKIINTHRLSAINPTKYDELRDAINQATEAFIVE